MTFSLSQRSLDNLAGVQPDLLRIVHGAILSTTIDFGVTGKAVRTAEEQHALFLRGVSQKDGYKSKSNHQPWADGLGHAVDLTAFMNGKPDFDNWDLYYHIASAMSLSAGALGLSGRLTWGGNWYQVMGTYGSTPDDMAAAVARYKAKHPGPDFIDGPHFQIT